MRLRILLKKILPKSIISFIRKFKSGNYFYFLWLFPINKRKIVVCNYYGKGYGDNAKYIINQLLYDKDNIRVVWLLKKKHMDSSKLPESIKIVNYDSFRALYELATAKIWIDNSRKVFSPPKRRGQYYIQTWHSPLRLKKIERDIENKLDESYIERAKIDSRNCDLMIAGNDFSWNIYRNSFWYDGEILKCGTPRCDLFFEDTTNIKEKVFNNLGISKNNKVILYAPTFRNNLNLDVYKLNFNEILDALKLKFSSEWKLLIRLHPNISNLASFINYNERIINATDYDDMQELLCATDILITDFSSSMFDMLIANKVCFLHAQDLEDYLNKERTLYFNIKELPFKFSTTNMQLIQNIIEFDEKEYIEKISDFKKMINVYEKGIASIEIAKKIKLFIK